MLQDQMPIESQEDVLSAVVHASSWENTSCPLCGAKKFTYVTMNVEAVTCKKCVATMDKQSPRS
jgi:predicted  nucleic acid-binding Zn-ribbon protein